MPLNDLVAPNAVLPALKVNTKKQALQELAARAAALSGQNERQIFEILTQREKLGSTAIGNTIGLSPPLAQPIARWTVLRERAANRMPRVL